MVGRIEGPAPSRGAPLVCGVDVGGLRTPSYVAWLRDGEFLLDLYLPSVDAPLPEPPAGWPAPAAIALDVPQGLPAPGRTRRTADALANTPTRRLPADRHELAAWRLYQGLVEVGVELFWAVHQRRLASIVGLAPADRPTIVGETYPRYVLRRLWPDLAIPSKRHAPLEYVEAVWGRVQARGYRCRSLLRPAVDQLDAMLCALAAESLASGAGLPPGTVGEAPCADEAGRVLREGFIVSP